MILASSKQVRAFRTEKQTCTRQSRLVKSDNYCCPARQSPVRYSTSYVRTVQLHTSGRYNKCWDGTKLERYKNRDGTTNARTVQSRNGTKIGTVHDLACAVLPCCRRVVRDAEQRKMRTKDIKEHISTWSPCVERVYLGVKSQQISTLPQYQRKGGGERESFVYI